MKRDWWHMPLTALGLWSYGAMLLMGHIELVALGFAFLLYLMGTMPNPGSRLTPWPYPEWLWGWPTTVIAMLPCLIFYARLLGWA